MRTVTIDEVRATAATLPYDRRNPGEEEDPGGGRCVYTDPEDPTCHCIVGEILARLEIPLPHVAPTDAYRPLNSTGIRALIKDGWFAKRDVAFDDDAKEYFALAQIEADRGLTWSQALYNTELRLTEQRTTA